MAEQITSRKDDYSQWYLDIVMRAGLADYSPVKGCMVIRPRGYAMWEFLKEQLDARLKETGHMNAYFPLFIPQSFIAKESEHIEGFAPELAVVTHGGGGELEEPLVVRPTSETIIWSMYKKWIQSYRDLPLLINQWANVVRWEKRTRPFLRTTEFLWQEGHTAHESEAEAREETLRIFDIYKQCAQEVLALPVIWGRKSEEEKFAGAVETYGIEALMQDGKSLQAGTSHFLGQKFAKAFEVQYQTRELSLEYVWATSWGVSTRLIGAVVMTHSDDKGLVVPPKIAPTHVVVIPIYKKGTDKGAIEKMAQSLTATLSSDYRVTCDSDDSTSPGWKFAEWELRGACVRVEVGPKDVEKKQCVVVRRDTGEKGFVPLENVHEHIGTVLRAMQDDLLQKARMFVETHTQRVFTFDEFVSHMQKDVPGYVVAPWDGTSRTEIAIKEKTKATIRVLREEAPQATDRCIYTGREAQYLAVFAKAY